MSSSCIDSQLSLLNIKVFKRRAVRLPSHIIIPLLIMKEAQSNRKIKRHNFIKLTGVGVILYRLGTNHVSAEGQFYGDIRI